MFRKKSLLALLLSLCMVVAMVPVAVLAAGTGMPQNIRWAESPKSMVQWDAPSGGGQYQYELRLKLGETIIDGPDLTVQRYHLFNGSLMTEARENYTVEIRARSCIIVGEFPNEYVTSPGEWGDWATLEGSGGGEGPTPPHEHSFGGWKNDGTNHWKECSCGEISEKSPHDFGEWELIYYDVNTKYDVCERRCLTCGYEQIDSYREHQHYYTDDWSSGSTTHWKVCYYCKEVNQDTVANHTFGDWTETKPATTTEEGLKERTCSVCEYTQEETIPVHTHDVHDKAWKYDDTNHWQECSCGEKLNVANHTFGDWTETKPATTTEEGLRERTCSVCEYTQEETIPVHEHSIHDETWKYNDTEHWQECSCGEKLNVANHIYGDWRETKPATETEAGSRERDCTVCDYVQTETIPMLEHEHSYGDWQKDETQHWKECRCGEKIEVGDHTYGEWKITKKPTTEETGTRERTCSTCNYKDRETLPVHEHSHNNKWEKDDAQHWRLCSCGEKFDIADHSFDNWTITKEPTTTETGSRERTCSICKYTQTETLPVHTHDVHDEAWKYDETEHWQECSCGEKLNVANHAYGEWRVTKPATETEEGSKARDCTVCDHVQTETIPMLEHEHGIHDETWKYDKTQHWQECSCGEKLNVANHIYDDWKVTKEATETEVGSRERGCTVCEYVQVEIIPEIGHEHGIHDETWKYDKTQHWQECSCGEKLNVANHTYGDWKVTKEATETEAGSRERGCAVCEYVQTETIPAAGTSSPQTGDGSDMALWIGLMLASCGGVLGMLLYRRKKAAAEK